MSTGITQDLWTEDAILLLLLPMLPILLLLLSLSKLPGPRLRSADQAGCPLVRLRQTPAPQCLRVSLYLFPNHPLDPLSAGDSPIFGSGGEGRGLPAPRSPRAQSSASRMTAELRAGRGQQVRGYSWRSSHDPAGHQLRAAQPLGPAPPRLRPRPCRAAQLLSGSYRDRLGRRKARSFPPSCLRLRADGAGQFIWLTQSPIPAKHQPQERCITLFIKQESGQHPFIRHIQRRRCCRCGRMKRAPRGASTPGSAVACRPSTTGNTGPCSPAWGTRRTRASPVLGTPRSADP